jgi:uncharacterized protein (DUF1499 family)
MARFARWLSILGIVVALGCALAALGAGLGYRFGFWHYRPGIAALGNIFWVALGTAVFCVLAALLAAATRGARATPLALAVLGSMIAGVTAWIPYDLRMTASKVPPIHDITTDIADPPKFVRVATLRGKDDHPVSYDRKVAEQQKKGYPDIATMALKSAPEKVFSAARGAIVAMGMELVDADASQGRIEATATSMVFGFKDDVVVRIAADGSGSKVDVRSKSRVGRNDFGMNAKRIRELQAKLRAAVGERA